MARLISRSIYHFYCLATNATTIEGWEKDKVAMLVRRGKIHEVRFIHIYSWMKKTDATNVRSSFHMSVSVNWGCFPRLTSSQNIGVKENVYAVLGRNPLFWCLPSIPSGTGLKYPVAAGHGKWVELAQSDGNGYGFGDHDRHTNGYNEDEDDASHQA